MQVQDTDRQQNESGNREEQQQEEQQRDLAPETQSELSLQGLVLPPPRPEHNDSVQSAESREQSQNEEDRVLSELINDLNSNSYAVRENATQALIQRPEAVDELLALACSGEQGDAQLRYCALNILQGILENQLENLPELSMPLQPTKAGRIDLNSSNLAEQVREMSIEVFRSAVLNGESEVALSILEIVNGSREPALVDGSGVPMLRHLTLAFEGIRSVDGQESTTERDAEPSETVESDSEQPETLTRQEAQGVLLGRLLVHIDRFYSAEMPVESPPVVAQAFADLLSNVTSAESDKYGRAVVVLQAAESLIRSGVDLESTIGQELLLAVALETDGYEGQQTEDGKTVPFPVRAAIGEIERLSAEDSEIEPAVVKQLIESLLASDTYDRRVAVLAEFRQHSHISGAFATEMPGVAGEEGIGEARRKEAAVLGGMAAGLSDRTGSIGPAQRREAEEFAPDAEAERPAGVGSRPEDR